MITTRHGSELLLTVLVDQPDHSASRWCPHSAPHFFNISSVNDDGAGLGDTNYTNNFGNANYAAVGGSGRDALTSSAAYWTFPTRGASSVYSTSSTSWRSGYNPSSDALNVADCFLNLISIHGDLA